MNPLEASGKPLFFKIADPEGSGLLRSGAPGVAIRTVARSLSVMQKEALVGSSATGNAWRLASDEGKYLMGDDVAPCPLAFMTAGMLASFTDRILALARLREIDLDDLQVTQDNYYTMEGSALRGTMTGGALPVDLRMHVRAPRRPDVLERLLADSVAASPVSALLGQVLPSRFTLTHNGREIETRRAAALGRPAEPWLEACFRTAGPDKGDWEGLVRRNGMSPETTEVTSSRGSSYAAEQSRRLHLRGLCTLRPDGVKDIEQHLLNPHGSIFDILSEESSEPGGGGHAPDALTCLSAGIAFCFMTQLGRYAKIVRKELREYGVIQDTGFTMGGNGAPPSASGVETHVYLESGEDDEFAREILDMAEQTCFLHALCRSELGVNAVVAART
jgi:organic hydroperoxide reductase OsmC/OhrA